MFKDKEEELERLFRELRETEEEPNPAVEEPDMDILLDDDTQIADMEDGVYRNASNDYGKNLRNFASGYQAYNGDKTDMDLDEISAELRADDDTEEKRLTGLTIAAFVLAAAVVGVLVYWLFRGGIF